MNTVTCNTHLHPACYSCNPSGSTGEAPLPRIFAGTVLVFVCILVCVGGAQGTVHYDFEQTVFIEPFKIVKDHALVQRNGTFHLYYIRHTQQSFGYATSPDLRHWTIHDPVLETGPEEWDCYNIWAPCIVEYPNFPHYLLMYYTGVNDSIAQRTCLALTRIPSLWTKASTALFTPFHGDTSWTLWREDKWSNYRDPCFHDEGGTCYLVQTATTKSRLGAIALARSDDYFSWMDVGPLYIHNSWHALESPFLLKRDGRYHLFFTEEAVGGISHMSSDSLTTGWDIVGRIIIDEGHAAELTGIGGDRHLISRHTTYEGPYGAVVSSIRFDSLHWEGDTPVVDMFDPLAGSWSVLWGDAFEHQPVFGNNPWYRSDDTTFVGFEGNWWIGTYESFCGPLTGTTPGDFQGDAPRGAIRSESFPVTGCSMRLLVGGGNYPDSCYVALCDEHTGQILFRETGLGIETMTERFWDLTPFRGRRVYLLIVDDSSAPFGHINVDGIEERQTGIVPSPHDGFEPIPIKPGRRMVARTAGSAADTDPTPPPPSVVCYPNPCNPHTEIVIQHAPGSRIDIIICSVAGTELLRHSIATDRTGTGTYRWNGCDRKGKILPSGLYFAILRHNATTVASCKLMLVR
ncbi:MAG: family 43 glycosylhydrolase [bacterium]|nr:MAG: family 43 glycosylhydrolase [bacterium]